MNVTGNNRELTGVRRIFMSYFCEGLEKTLGYSGRGDSVAVSVRPGSDWSAVLWTQL